MSREDSVRKSRRHLGELLGLAPCPAPSPQLFKAVLNAAPRPRPHEEIGGALPRWRQPRFAVVVTALVMAAAVSLHYWESSSDDELADVDELAAASSLVL